MTGRDGTVSVRVYDTEAGAEGSTRVAAAFIRENMPRVSSAPPLASSGGLAIHA